MKSENSFGTEQITTRFYKVRLTITRLKNGNYKEIIDCTDMSFQTSKGMILICESISQSDKSFGNIIFYDSNLYAHAISHENNINSVSVAKVDLMDTPF